ncbi:Enoyl-CoA hydratase/carnithine racemase (CaiD) (PDB:1DCI) [Commensalibacter communis]|uniref:enoyl-CoA hydratase/isomerase family protein n=1 Tax=Commensalibacter communis TaxID=2972786 RepID=UPI0022FF568F|nr:enoyl-CoA hydratase/isomerase family protein [Commensalibacter communis]CAI3937820.1 Enoyl-CoA hydratase/carnithine racemase (CaiD) (PDB:1DCI) [Commensalibacter communis]CAI3940370.1 Enoyl-CoA hydratase/carnithine racemase (CaiD) (PDB:1DCI) [Commensalibacter communis]CAI3943636.1 Enoyl-CoA hydratase/carnithine racemase (CaiD) (PDB:1DCI) [Commensalibacter communis]CAI3944944.1 Enoyl-CoA hydratase/carnithine racemase (CaiD) (PDB:1DCI) [Commensalibacter communis]
MNRLITTQKRGKLGILTLNRPKFLNAINAALQQEIISQLELWRTDRQVQEIVINSSHAKAFCAGGDIREIASFVKAGQYEQAVDVFLHNYQLVYYVSNYPKPVISIMDGITMGGGVGLGCFSSHRIVTGRAVLAMPEVMIGLSPDAGSNLLFSKAPGYTGLRMMLTGKRFHAEEAIKLGFADYMVSSSMVDYVLTQLEKRDMNDVLSFLKREKEYDSSFLQEVESVYNAPDVKTIISNLKQSNFLWAKEDLKEISQACPFSLHITYKAWQNKLSDLGEVLEQDLSVISHLVMRSDFMEGVRASVIDKDRSPKWSNAPILPKIIDTCFVSSYKLYS